MSINSRAITLGLLVLLAVSTSLWLLIETTSHLWVTIAFGISVPALLLLGAIRKVRNWAQLIALAMIFYCTIGVMDIVASSGQFMLALSVALVSVALFFSSLHAARS